MDRRLFPVLELELGGHHGPLLSKNLQKPRQGLLDVFSVDSITLGDVVHVNYTL
jgi:hypothetical protein